MELCRLCTVLVDRKDLQKLFERSQRKLLRQLEQLTGLRFGKTKDLPQHVCKPCQDQTLQAHEFCERVIRVQQEITSTSKKNRAKRNHTMNKEGKSKVLPIEKLSFDETMPVKEEEELPEEQQSLLTSMLEIPLKLEVANAADNSNGSFNPLDDHQRVTEDEQDMLPFDMIDLNTSCIEEPDKVEETPQVTTLATQIFVEEQPTRPTKRKYKQRKKCEPNETGVTCDPKEKRKEPKRKPLYICEQCGAHFSTPFNLEIHLRRHVGDKQYQCTICPEKCYTKRTLDRHIRRHTGELPFPCRYCERRFIDHYPRIRHERTHTQTRPFACTQCGKAFTVSDTLKRHMLVHTGIRAFSCKVCNRMFLHQKNLVTHYRSMTHKQNMEKSQQLEESKNS